jgi:hypothetical protein
VSTDGSDQARAAISTPRRIRGAALAVAGLLGSAAVFTAVAAPAQATSGYGYDGQNPYGSGCFNGSYVVDDKALGRTGAHVRLHYSPNCRTVWASIYNATAAEPGNSAGGHADIHRNSDNHRFDCQVYAGDGGSCYTAMLYDGGVTSHAHGTEDNGFVTGAAYTIDF